MIGPTWLRPWYWRIPYHILEWMVTRSPFGRWANRLQQRIVDRYGPFGPGRGYWVVVHDKQGRRLERSPGVPRNYAIEPEVPSQLEQPSSNHN